MQVLWSQIELLRNYKILDNFWVFASFSNPISFSFFSGNLRRNHWSACDIASAQVPQTKLYRNFKSSDLRLYCPGIAKILDNIWVASLALIWTPEILHWILYSQSLIRMWYRFQTDLRLDYTGIVNFIMSKWLSVTNFLKISWHFVFLTGDWLTTHDHDPAFNGESVLRIFRWRLLWSCPYNGGLQLGIRPRQTP